MVCKRVGQSLNAPFGISLYVSLCAVCKHHSEMAKASLYSHYVLGEKMPEGDVM
jgi:hypothetical protein